MRKTKIQFADACSVATILRKAQECVKGFSTLYRRFERKMTIAWRSSFSITNYGCHITAISLHFQCLPTELNQVQLEDYLYMLQSKEQRSPSRNYFKLIVFGL